MSEKFTKCLMWTWERFFIGGARINTTKDATKDQVMEWIEKQNTSLGSCGNYDKNSLSCKLVKVKTKDLVLTKVN